MPGTLLIQNPTTFVECEYVVPHLALVVGLISRGEVLFCRLIMLLRDRAPESLVEKTSRRSLLCNPAVHPPWSGGLSLPGTSAFRKCLAAGRHGLPSHGELAVAAPVGGRRWRRIDAFSTVVAQVVAGSWSRTSGSVRRGSRRAATGCRRDQDDRWRTVAHCRGRGHYSCAHLRLSDDPSQSLTVRRPCRARLVGSDTEEVTASNPVAPTMPALTSAFAQWLSPLGTGIPGEEGPAAGRALYCDPPAPWSHRTTTPRTRSSACTSCWTA
jgi:hypothetical protein